MGSDFHLQGDIRHLIGADRTKSPVFRIVGCDAEKLVLCHIGDLLS